MYALPKQLSAGIARMAIIFRVDVSAHVLLLWGAGSRQELDIGGVHSNPNLHDCGSGGGQAAVPQHVLSERGGKDGGTGDGERELRQAAAAA